MNERTKFLASVVCLTALTLSSACQKSADDSKDSTDESMSTTTDDETSASDTDESTSTDDSSAESSTTDEDTLAENQLRYCKAVCIIMNTCDPEGDEKACVDDCVGMTASNQYDPTPECIKASEEMAKCVSEEDCDVEETECSDEDFLEYCEL